MIDVRLLPLFLVSAAAVGFETALTRYFAVASWSEYGYWIISIVMAGFAFSGVAVSLCRDACLRHGQRLMTWLPVGLIFCAAGGYWAVTINPFNPLQLQNATTYLPQLANIGLYYAALLPYFFLTGLYVSLSFLLNSGRVATVYGYDLLGAGAGSALLLGVMFMIHPMVLAPVLLLPLLAACWCGPVRAGLAGTACFGAGLVLLLESQASYNDFKPIYAPLHVTDSRVMAQVERPRGLYALLDDFTERLDTDLSNDLGLLNLPGPPRAYGLYRDGIRIAALAKPGPVDARYATATLAALPYLLDPGARVLLGGVSGGFHVAEALALGASQVEALEPDPVITSALRSGLGGSPPLVADGRVQLSSRNLLAAARDGGGRYGIIDIAGDFLGTGDADSMAFTVEALAADLSALDETGIVSIPVSIRDFPVYALRVLGSARAALRMAGKAEPSRHVVIYRSAWNARILVSPAPWTVMRIAAVRRWCDARSFDVSYYPGMDVAASRAAIYNDLPVISFEAGTVASGPGADDAIADEALAVLDNRPTPSDAAFALSPATLDRSAYYDVLRLSHLSTIFRRLEILPQPEIGQLVNLAVLAQAIVIAMLVLLVPIFGRRRPAAASGRLLRPVVYFASLGLGFLFIEIAMIDRAALYLNDRTSAFSLVLTTMLVFSGLGSLLTGFVTRAGLGIGVACSIAIGWCLIVSVASLPVMVATLDWPWICRALLLIIVLIPISIPIGMPFAIGLQVFGSTPFLPVAWAINGAFSVVATPLANLIETQYGGHWVLLGGAMLYLVSLLAHISVERSLHWQTLRA